MAKYVQYSSGLALHIRYTSAGQYVTQGQIVNGRFQPVRSWFIEAAPSAQKVAA